MRPQVSSAVAYDGEPEVEFEHTQNTAFGARLDVDVRYRFVD